MKVGNSFSGILAFSFPGAIGLLAGLLAVFPVSSYDTWWILAAGERMLETGTILTTGVGSWTRGQEPYDYHGWGFAVVAAWCHRLAGTWGLIALRSLLA
ncbi:MAG TPA: hypothetical protein VHP35_05740, partial [Terriglobia bacterium]|nr:hypothetical protein [Terriglobia bacterium]